MATYDNYRNPGSAAEARPGAGDGAADIREGAREGKPHRKTNLLAWVIGLIVMALALITIIVSVAGSGVATVTVTTAWAEEDADGSQQAQAALSEVAVEPLVSVYPGDVADELMQGGVVEEAPVLMTQVPVNQTVTLDALTARGTYTIVVVDTPVLQDGTVFIGPDPQVIELQGENVNVNFLLVEDLG